MKRQKVIELDCVETTKKFNIDWENVLVDEEVPELEIIGGEPFEPTLSGDDTFPCVKTLSDSELNDHMTRQRSLLASFGDRLPDKGGRIRSRIGNLEYEKQRRMLRRTKTERKEMSTESYEDALKRLGELLSKKSDIGKVAAAKIKQLTVELEELDSNKSSDAVERIKSGFIHFKTHKYLKKPSLYNALAKGQSPKFLVFACADSRVCPTHILNFKPGEAFVVRNIGNMVPLFDKTQHSGVGAALEYPVTVLNVENILVIGHSRCGGIKGLMSIEDDAAPPKSVFIENWVTICTPAKNRIKQDFKHLSFNDQCTACEKEAVNVSLGNLLSYPFVRERVVKNKLAIRGAHYDFVNGTFDLWDLDFKTTPAISLS